MNVIIHVVLVMLPHSYICRIVLVCELYVNNYHFLQGVHVHCTWQFLDKFLRNISGQNASFVQVETKEPIRLQTNRLHVLGLAFPFYHSVMNIVLLT